MRDRNARIWNQLGELCGDSVDAGHPVVHEKDLPLAQQFPADGRPDLLVVVRPDEGENRMPVFRWSRQRRHLPDAGDRHLQGARDRRRAHRQDVDIGFQLFEGVLVLDAETLLLVDDDQAEVLDGDVLRQQPVRSDDDVDGSVGQAPDRVLRLLVGLKTAEPPKVHGEPGETFGKGFQVLLNQQGRRNEHDDLFAILNRFECRANSHLCLAVADIARDESVHRDRPLHIGFDLVDGCELVGSLDERERFL